LGTKEHLSQGKVLHPPNLKTDRGKATWEEYTGRRVKHAEPANM